MRKGRRMLDTVLVIVGLRLVSVPLSRWDVSFYYQYKTGYNIT
jgi:hypothetical protein